MHPMALEQVDFHNCSAMCSMLKYYGESNRTQGLLCNKWSLKGICQEQDQQAIARDWRKLSAD